MGESFWNRRLSYDMLLLICVIAIGLTIAWSVSSANSRVTKITLKECTWELIDGKSSIVRFINGKEAIGPGDIVLGRRGDLFYGSCLANNGVMEMFVYNCSTRKAERYKDEVQGVLRFDAMRLRYDSCVSFFNLRSAQNKKELIDMLNRQEESTTDVPSNAR